MSGLTRNTGTMRVWNIFNTDNICLDLDKYDFVYVSK